MKPTRDEVILQKVFRRVLQAMSRPGRIYSIAIQHPASSRWESLIWVLRSILDHEVSFCVTGNGASKELAKTIYEATKSRTADIESADYIIVTDGNSRGEIRKAKRGTLEYPDQSATVIFFLPSLLLKEEGMPQMTLKGPGIRDEFVATPPRGLELTEMTVLKEINSEFPLGADTLFIDADGRIMALPRSTIIEIKEG